MDFNNLKQDDQIADILKKLKEAESKVSDKLNDNTNAVANDNNTITDDKVSSDNITYIDEPTLKFNSSNELPPWFKKSDLDTELMHYIKQGDSGKLEYSSIKLNKSALDIASLKLKQEYLCDIDYYKSKHYVLYIKQLDSDYKCNKLYTQEELRNIINVEDTSFITEDTLTESVTQPIETSLDCFDETELTTKILNEQQYYKYIIFTDSGIMDFVVNQSNVSYPYLDSNLNKWFEETSNYTQIKQAHYYANSTINSSLEELQDCKYDIITMHYPGVITLDSTHSDTINKLTIKLKEEYNFIPLNRLLSCFKYYANSNLKSNTDLKLFISKYFDVIK